MTNSFQRPSCKTAPIDPQNYTYLFENGVVEFLTEKDKSLKQPARKEFREFLSDGGWVTS